MATHVCNLYCTEDAHCDLFYTDARAGAGAIVQMLGWSCGLKVVAAQPAREAPRLVEQPADAYEVLYATPRSGEPNTPWLVWFR